ncbi:conjugative transposon protein TraK [Sediminibacterium ginsengisoli]|uniref:Bacteroides conjugative transposon TraK protein n=1 Tax=Sediminibacterium ginsengisoli TaxID=413434 RepID=A0A1T4NXF8_9BACT|nr:conjugative transposon protein TraK [Sediminibacterium ginsengisoli]SJZ83716.1 Bacteroides conjugative transposon TraK protein [Sediminibacterium ginsengisoli]
MIFKPTDNLDKAFRAMRAFMVLIVIGSLSVSMYALYQNAVLSARMQDRVYILSNGKAAEVFSSSRKENVAVEARDHISRFHQLFFSLDPDEKAIASTIKKALYLADGSAKKQYDDLVESGYIAGVISGNVSQEVTIDSVQVSVTTAPYLFRCYATVQIIRSTSIVIRNLITHGQLRNTARSDNNPHGFLIEKWETIENRDIKIENR